MNQDDVIYMLGGKIELNEVPSSFPLKQFSSFTEHALSFTRLRLAAYASKLNFEVDLEIINSPSVTCRSRAISDGHYLIAIPIGALIRIRVLSRILLSYWHRSKSPDVGVSHDALGQGQVIPPALSAVFTENYADYWRDINGFDETLSTEEFESDVEAIVNLAFYFLVGHEASHVFRRHDFLIKKTANELHPDPSQVRSVLWRFAEIDADIMGLHWALGTISSATTARRYADNGAYSADPPVAPELAWLRLAYAVTLVFGSYDIWRRELGNYALGRYPHPIVRWQISSAVVREYVRLDASEKNDGMLDNLVLQQEAGYFKCIDAFKWLNYDINHEVFGAPSPGSHFSPIATLMIDESNLDVTQREFRADVDLYTAAVNMFLTVADDEDVWAQGIGFALEPAPVLHAGRDGRGGWTILGENLTQGAFDIFRSFALHPTWGGRLKDSLRTYGMRSGPYRRLVDSIEDPSSATIWP